MEMFVELIDGSTTKANLEGRLDLPAVQDIGLPFNVILGSRSEFIVDAESSASLLQRS